MTTHRVVIELNWNWRTALVLAAVVAAPLLAATGLLTALAAHTGSAPSSPAHIAPTAFTYQGQVQVNGHAFSGTGQFKFAIISLDGTQVFWTNDGSGLGGAPVQPASAVNLPVAGGLFTVQLGDPNLPHMTQPITSGVFAQADRALRVWFNDGINGFQQLAPDVALASVPYALSAQTLGGLDSGAFALAAHTHAAADITSGTLDDARLSADVVLGDQAVSRLSNDAGYLTQFGADYRYAPLRPTSQQIAQLKWYTAVSSTQANFATGPQPDAVAFDGANIWVANSGLGTISVLRASDGTHVLTPTVGYGLISLAYDGANMWLPSFGTHVFTATTGNYPDGIAFDGTNMWVVNQGDGSVSVLRDSDGANVMTPTVGAAPVDVAFDRKNMWVTNCNSNSVSVLQAATGAPVLTPTVGGCPGAIAFDGTNMWVANYYSNTVTVLRAADGTHVLTPTVGTHPSAIAFDGANMWVTNYGDNTVSVLRVADSALVATVPVGAGPYSIAFDGAYMWIANYNSATVSKR